MRQGWFELGVFGVVLVVGLAGCDDEGVRAYRASKAAAPKVATPAPMPAAKQADVTWTVPPGWRAVASDQAMRVATFRAGEEPGVEVSVAAFPGDVGGTLANVNRWRGQVGLAPATEQDLASMLETVKVEGVEVSTLTLVGAQGQEVLGAMIHPGDGKTWFVKATADPKAAEGFKGSFVAFARSFRLERGAAAPPKAPATDESAVIGGRIAAWEPPTNWKAESNAAGIAAAAFGATNDEGGARVTATSLVGDGGGPLANINRWRDQLGLMAVPSLASQATTDLGKGGVEVDIADTPGTKRMIAAIVPAGAKTWFFKLTGTPKGVEAEKAAFDTMVRGVGLGEQ